MEQPSRVADESTHLSLEATTEYSERVLHETKEKKKEYLKELREWLQTNTDLNPYTDEYNLVRFLRATKYNLESAKKKLTAFYTFKSTAPEWFTNRDPLLPQIQSLLKTGVFLPLVERDEEGRMVILIRTGAHDPATQQQNDVFKVGLMTLDLALQAEDTSVYGVVALFDMAGVSLQHARQLSVKMIHKAVSSWQIYPVRVRSLDFINSPPYINVVLNVFRAFMSQKIKDRVHVHGSSQSSLHGLVPRSILPTEYGGTAGPLQDLIDYWHKRVTNSRNWFLQDEKHQARPK